MWKFRWRIFQKASDSCQHRQVPGKPDPKAFPRNKTSSTSTDFLANCNLSEDLCRKDYFRQKKWRNIKLVESDCFFRLCVLEKLRSNRQRDRRKNVFLRYFKFYDYYTLIDFLLGALKTFSFFFSSSTRRLAKKTLNWTTQKRQPQPQQQRALLREFFAFLFQGAQKETQTVQVWNHRINQMNVCTRHIFSRGLIFFFSGGFVGERMNANNNEMFHGKGSSEENKAALKWRGNLVQKFINFQFSNIKQSNLC